MSSISTTNGSNGHAVHGSAHRPHHPAEPEFIAARRAIDMSVVTVEPGFGRGLSIAFWLLGAIACGAIAFVAVTAKGAGAAVTIRHALGSYHIGFLYVLGLALGALGTQMIFQQFNAGWCGSVRRQAENIASLIWVAFILFLPVVIIELAFTHGALFRWMDPSYTMGDPVYQHKAAYLNVTSWFGWPVRAGLYFVIWTYFAARLYGLSRKQDQTGDPWLTAKARFLSSWGLLVFGLTTTFAAFDWLMSLDYHWFSTMFGVCFFAGNAVASTALLIVLMCWLKAKGKFGSTFTHEHMHDLGKLLFAFTVFWAYVTLSEYFLIWYGNIPEESAYFNLRKTGPYNTMGIIICFGHFAVPFLFLLIRLNKRRVTPMIFIGLWMLVMHGIDLIYLARPVIESVPFGQNVWVDVLGMLGPLFLFLGFVINKLSSCPLAPIKDPRLNEILEHRNYV